MVTIARWIPKFSLSALVRVGIGLALVACVLVDAAGWIEVRALTQLELWAYDARVRLFLPRTRDPRIVIVDIDERSLSAEGHWPWDRWYRGALGGQPILGTREPPERRKRIG